MEREKYISPMDYINADEIKKESKLNTKTENSLKYHCSPFFKFFSHI